MSIRTWPKNERPRERLFQIGPEALSDMELLAILIVSGSPRGKCTALDCARSIVGRYDDFRSLSGISLNELTSIPGIGPGKASRILAAMEIVRRTVKQQKKQGAQFKDSQDVFSTYFLRMRDAKQEIFTAVMLDSKNRFLCEKKISMGTLNQSIVHPRDVFLAAIRESAASVILIHNHPSGDPLPSDEDLHVTQRMVDAGRLLGIAILDHIIIGEGRYFSFCDEKCLEGPVRKREKELDPPGKRRDA